MRLSSGQAAAIILAVAAMCGPALRAQGAGKELADPVGAYNELAAKRAKVLVGVRELDVRLSTAWRDPELTSPRIEELRAEIARLEQELAAARRALSEEIAAQPEINETRAKRAEALAEAETLQKQMNAVRGDVRVVKPLPRRESTADGQQ